MWRWTSRLVHRELELLRRRSKGFSVFVLIRLAILESAEKLTLKIGTAFSELFYRTVLFGVGL
jgi:hypothetical protein